jgi:hypothetical protein
MLSVVILSDAILSVVILSGVYAKCRIFVLGDVMFCILSPKVVMLWIVVLNVIVMIVIILKVVMLNVIIRNVVVLILTFTLKS